MTVRHRQRKGAKGKSFLYARGKAFPKPQLFRRNRPKIPRRHRITLHTPPAFSASFCPATAPLPALFAAKGGFSPPTPAVPAPEGRPTAPFCPGAARLSPGAPRKEAPAAASKPGARPAPEARKRPRVRLFAPFAPVFSAVRRPNARMLPRPPPKPPRRAPPAAPLGHSLGAGKSDFPGQLFHFAVEKRVPQGGIKSLKSGGWRPPPTLA